MILGSQLHISLAVRTYCSGFDFEAPLASDVSGSTQRGIIQLPQVIFAPYYLNETVEETFKLSYTTI